MIEAKSLGLEEARSIVETILETVQRTMSGRPVSIAVVDNAGILIYFVRMDGTNPVQVRMAINKAYTAIQWQRDTREIQTLVKEEADISWFGDLDRQAPVAGGVLVRSSDGSVVGAIGISGRPHFAPMGDEELAQIGASAFRI